MNIENIKLFKNGRIGGYINKKGWRFLSNCEVDNIIKQNMKGGNKSEIYNKLKNILDKKRDNYTNIGQIFNPTSKKRKEVVSELRTKINKINENNNTQLNNIIKDAKQFFNNSKKNNKIKKNANKLFTNYHKYLMGSENNLCKELTNTSNQHKNELTSLGTGGNGSVELIEYNNKKYAIKKYNSKFITHNDIESYYRIHKLLFDKCNYLLKKNKLININYNFIIEPICLNNNYDILMEAGDYTLSNILFENNLYINNYIVEQIKNILLNFALLQMNFNPIFFCSDLKLNNMIINYIDNTDNRKFQIKLIDIGPFCNMNNFIRGKKCSNPFINNECLLNSDKIEFDDIPIYNTFNKHKKDLFITVFCISYIIFILQNREILLRETVNYSQIEIQFLKNKILSKCLINNNKTKISKILNNTEFGHIISGLNEDILNDLYKIIDEV
jgi:hypothetical protein